ncbi:(2Fe-2S)-binding protein [Peloplasma aerotolerans]|uniref:(2Fe-2S)-binding protein n=1 Tax=Peloplasma aerotolerans TaxID=3044389 RepID=A0AAW6U5V9_9MOLU|nr:(2Fe-2S)-binding protein [Mariniplasma sp. M4Ah]MDI6453368.1 (2Fe-2S)-binding protein [Mariniplasma sp. M4Ah]
MRIKKHPILTFPEREEISFIFEGKNVIGYQGDTIASALHDLDIKTLSYSIKLNRPRGFYCAIGNCASCNMVVNGKPNVRTCITPLKENMTVERQKNKGVLK